MENNRMDLLAGDNKQVTIEFYLDGALVETFKFDLNYKLHQSDVGGMTALLKGRGAKQYNLYNTQNGGRVLVKSVAL